MVPEPATALPTVLAHQTWFTDGPFPTDWSFAGEPLTLVLLAAALAVTGLVRLIARRVPGVDVPFLARLVPWMPFAVRMHLGVSLVGLLSLGAYLSPAMDLEPNVGGWALGVVMAVVAFSMVTGWHTRAGAGLLIAAGPLGMLEFGVGPVAQRADLLGLAVFLLFAGAGRWSADAEAARAPDPSPADLAKAVWALRVGAGAALIVVAFAEKLANPAMALAFLAEYPDFNVAALVGLPLGDLAFIRLAGAIEVLFGLLLISGALPQAIVVMVGVPFNVTLYFFGTDELVGHLPVYGAMLVLLVLGSHPQLRPAVSALWPFGLARSRGREPVSLTG